MYSSNNCQNQCTNYCYNFIIPVTETKQNNHSTIFDTNSKKRRAYCSGFTVEISAPACSRKRKLHFNNTAIYIKLNNPILKLGHTEFRLTL